MTTRIIELHDSLQVSDSPTPVCCVDMEKARIISAKGEEPVWVCPQCKHVQYGNKPTKPIIGNFSLELIRASDGEVVERRGARNVFTDVGRNWLAHNGSYFQFTSAPGADEPHTSKRRFDGVRYMMVGIGTQLETNAVVKLQNPVPYNGAGDYLAQVIAPNELPGTGVSALYQRTYGINEISVSGPVTITEAGLYYSGVAGAALAVTDQNVPPIAYKVFEPVTVTVDFLLAIKWEIKY